MRRIKIRNMLHVLLFHCFKEIIQNESYKQEERLSGWSTASCIAIASKHIHRAFQEQRISNILVQNPDGELYMLQIVTDILPYT